MGHFSVETRALPGQLSVQINILTAESVGGPIFVSLSPTFSEAPDCQNLVRSLQESENMRFF